MKIQIKPVVSNPRQHIQKIFDSILEKHLNNVPEDDMIGVTLCNQSFTKPVFVTFRKRNNSPTERSHNMEKSIRDSLSALTLVLECVYFK